MPTKAKKILITTEKHEVFIVRAAIQESMSGFCASCGHEVEVLTLDSAVSTSKSNGRELIRRIGADEVHLIDAQSGHLLVCKSSLRGK